MSRLLPLLLSLLSLAACTPRRSPGNDPIAAIPVAERLAHSQEEDEKLPDGINAPNLDVVRVTPGNSKIPLLTRRLSSRGLALTILTFDSRAYSLQVLDNEDGPGTGSKTSKAAAKTKNGLAAINGGFFTPEGNPLGLVHEQGRKYGGLSTSSLGAGVYARHTESRLPAILTRSAWQQQPSSQPPLDLLQSGPFLLRNGNIVSGLSTTRPRERSFLLWDGKSGWAIGHSSSTSLASLSKSLAAQPLPGFHIQQALNLDGGSSSDLWISPQVKGGPASTRHLWNKNVRNYLVLVPTRP